MPTNRVATILRNVTTLTVAQFATFGISFVTSILVIRYLGVNDFGRYSLVITLTTIFGFAVDLGLSQLVIREVAQDRSRSTAYFGNFFAVQGLIAIVVYGLLVGTVYGLGYPPAVVFGAWVVGGGMVLGALIRPFTAILTALEEMHIIAAVNVVVTLVNLGLLILLIHFHFGLHQLYFVSPLTNLCSLILFVWLAQRYFSTRVHWDGKLLVRLLRLAIPFALLMAFNIIYGKIDVFMISRILQSDHAVGLYSSAYRIIDALIIIPSTISTVLFPIIAQEFQNSERLRFVVLRAIKFSAAIGIPTAVGITWLASPIVLLLFGPRYAADAPVLRILIWMIAIISSYSIIGNLLISANRVSLLVKLNIIGIVANVILNFYFIRRWGITGAAISSVGSEALMLACHAWFARQYVQYRPLIRDFAKILLACALMAAVLTPLRTTSVFIAIPVGAVIYIAALLISRFIRPDEQQLIRQLRGRSKA